jgi:polar amino acid transport system permease protein
VNFRHLLDVLLFGYPPPPEMVDAHFPAFLQRSGGLLLTFLIAVFSLTIGAGIGLVLALCRREPAEDMNDGIFKRPIKLAIRHAAAALVETIRGLPIMLLVLLAFYLPYPLLGLRLPNFVLAVAAFSLYAGVYLSEIMRAGFRSVDSRFRSVGRVLGLSPWKVFLKIELPLLCRNMLPDLINLTVTVFKDTSTLAVVAVPELSYIGRQVLMSEPADYQLALLIILVLYWLPSFALSLFAFRAGQWREGFGEIQSRASMFSHIRLVDPGSLD